MARKEKTETMAKINIRGDIVLNEHKRFYDWLGWDCVCPRDVQDIIDAAAHDEPLDVYINSPGGIVAAGQEIYSALRGDPRVSIHITGQACSAASFIAMAGLCDITPVGLMMVHCASMGYVSGNHNDMERAAQCLTATDNAIAAAYAEKSGMSVRDALKLMERETWLTANQCIGLGLVDGITPETAPTTQIAASFGGIRLTKEDMEKVDQAIKEQAQKESREKALLEDLDLFGV